MLSTILTTWGVVSQSLLHLVMLALFGFARLVVGEMVVMEILHLMPSVVV